MARDRPSRYGERGRFWLGEGQALALQEPPNASRPEVSPTGVHRDMKHPLLIRNFSLTSTTIDDKINAGVSYINAFQGGINTETELGNTLS